MFVVLALLLNGMAWASDTFIDSFFYHLPGHQHDRNSSTVKVKDKVKKWKQAVRLKRAGQLFSAADGSSEPECSHHCHGGTHIVVGVISVTSYVAMPPVRLYYTPGLFSHISIKHTPPVPPPLSLV